MRVRATNISGVTKTGDVTIRIADQGAEVFVGDVQFVTYLGVTDPNEAMLAFVEDYRPDFFPGKD